MGKGSWRRPEDSGAVRRNWPFPPRAGWCVTCGAENRPVGEWGACPNPSCAAFDEVRASVSYDSEASQRRRVDAEWDKLTSERLDGTRPDCIYECGTWEECDGECKAAAAP
jgi:hypothetical protein